MAISIYQRKGPAYFYQKYNNYTLESHCDHLLEKSEKAYEFLSNQVGTFNCDELIEDHKQGVLNNLPNHKLAGEREWYYIHYYQSLLIRASWEVFGESRQSIIKLSKIFSFIFLGIVFWLFLQLFKKNPIIASLLTLTFSFNQHFTYNIQNYRHLSKAPFGMTIFEMMYYFFHHSFKSFKNQLLFLFGVGIVQGLGLGIRMDLKIFIPFCIAIIITKCINQTKLRNIFLFIAVYFAGTAVSNAPQYINLKDKSKNVGHFLSLGYSQRFNGTYQYEYKFSPAAYHRDAYIYDMMKKNAQLNKEKGKIVIYGSEMGNRYNFRYFKNLLVHTPGYIFHRLRQTIPALFGNWLPRKSSYASRIAIGYAATILAFFFLLSFPMRKWFFYFFSFSFVIGPMFIQFSGRHFFYMVPLLVFLIFSINKDRKKPFVDNFNFSPTNLKTMLTLLVLILPLVLSIIDFRTMDNIKKTITENDIKIKDKFEVKELGNRVHFISKLPTDDIQVLVSLRNCKKDNFKFTFLKQGKPRTLKDFSALKTKHYIVNQNKVFPIHSFITDLENKECIEFFRYQISNEGPHNIRLTGEI